jgi:hypothetical protein
LVVRVRRIDVRQFQAQRRQLRLQRAPRRLAPFGLGVEGLEIAAGGHIEIAQATQQVDQLAGHAGIHQLDVDGVVVAIDRIDGHAQRVGITEHGGFLRFPGLLQPGQGSLPPAACSWSYCW